MIKPTFASVASLLPITQWSRGYNMPTAIGDLIAGITVALTLVPQSIAYAGLAGLERSFLVEFVSLPVVSGFTSAAAVTIASSQIKGLLGLKFSSEGFVSTWAAVIEHIGEIRLPDTLLSIVCCIVLMGMKRVKDIKVKLPEDKKKQRQAIILNRAFWFVGVSRNAVVVALATVLAYFIHENNKNPFLLTGKITPGLPTPQPPAFHTEVGNTTYTGWEMLGHLGSGLLVVPLVGIISNVAIAKSFARGKTLAATQEIVALGICNVVGSFFRSFPVNGSFSRSAVSDASGVRTPAAGFYTGFIVIVTLVVLTPYFYFIPRAALASVIVCAVLHMIDVDIVFSLWKTTRFDLIPLFGTFICCLALGIEIGLVCGVVIDAILLMYYQSRPSLHLNYTNDGDLPPHYAIAPAGGLHFAAAEAVRSKITTLQEKKQKEIENISVINERVQNGHNTVQNSHNGILNSQNAVPNGQIPVPNGHISVPNGLSTMANGHVGENRGSNSQNEQLYTVQLWRNSQIDMPASNNILVIYCKSLNRMDYTFLQSVKSLTTSWSHQGLVIWCDVQPQIKAQLDYVLRDVIYCDSEGLKRFLLNVISMHESQTASIGDTHL